MTTAPQRLILVGSTGRVGTMVRRAWDSHPPMGLDVVYQTRRGDGFVWDPLDGPDPLRDLVQKSGPLDTMVVLAGAVPAGGADLSLNVSIAQACMTAAVKTGIKRVLLASSSAVYGASKSGTYHERDALNPMGDYGRAKVQMEAACQPFRTQGVEVCCLRIGNVAGADALLLNAEKPELVIDQFASGGFPVRSYIGPQTFARVLAHLALSDAPLPEYLNVAAPHPVSMRELADAAGLNWRATPAPGSAQELITLDCKTLSHIYAFDAADATPMQMVQEWYGVRA